MAFSVQSDFYASLRLRMVESQLVARGIRDERVLDAMVRLPRHEFVPQRFREQSYEDHPIPIGREQTISQPYIVALMLETLQLTENEKVLEVGTGSGYVTALLAELTSQVVSIERHASLSAEAGDVLTRLGYRNVLLIVGDGSLGSPVHAPFHGILVSAAAAVVPAPLLSQLAAGGRMIIPVGKSESQELQLIRMNDGEPVVSLRAACRFVPLVASAGEQ